jgi:putative ABC transport system permease protein
MIAIMLLISAVSVGTLVSFCVHSRRRSFGIRRSLGATRGQIVKLILLENLILAIAAILLGLIIALTGEQIILRYFQLGGLKPLHMILGACVVLIATLISAITPALAFVRQNPVEAMS